MAKLFRLLAAVVFLVAGGGLAPAQVTFDSSFESGNGRLFVSTGPTSYDFQLELDSNSTDRQWFYFAVNGAAGQTLSFRLLNTNSTNVSSHWNDARPVFSRDGGATWQYTTGTVSNTSTTWTFTHTFVEDSERLALHFPYTLTMLNAKLPAWEAHADATTTVLGNSVQGRPITYFRVTDASVPNAGKLGVWVIARQHAAEVTGSYTMEGFMDFLLSSEMDARAVRAGAILHIVPMMNPDGVVIGNYRNNSAGVNLNRVWDGSANLTTSPEVRLVQDKLAQTVSAGDGGYKFFLDIHSTSGAGPHFAFHAASSIQPPLYPTPATYHTDSRRYLQLVNDAAPWFSPTAGASTSNDQALAYQSQRIQYGVLAFNPEGVYTRQVIGPNPSAFQTIETHRVVGEAMVKALAAYYALEAPDSGSSLWCAF